MTRIFSSFAAACFFSIVFLFALKNSIDVSGSQNISNENLRVIDFVRLQREELLQKKERIKPKKPQPKKKPIKPKVNIPKPTPPEKLDINRMQRLNINLPIDMAATSALGDAMVATSGGAVNANVIPLARINPIYPKRAKMMKIEGFVALEFTITQLGTVRDIKILNSQPPKIFDRSASRALSKWKFKPKVVNQVAVEQRASVQINFKLDGRK